MLDNVIKFVNYWYFRYLLVTELYIVEKWERVVIHLILLGLFLGLWWFNSNILLNAFSSFTPRGKTDDDLAIPLYSK